MKSIANFYQGLDALNLILFWGIIIVIILLLVFSIILVNKNKKLKEMLVANNHKHEDDMFTKEDDIPVITTPKVDIKDEESNYLIKEKTEEIVMPDIPPKEDIIVSNIPVNEPEIIMPSVPLNEPKVETKITENNPPEEKKFVAEEHVMEYNQRLFNIPNIEKNNEPKEEEKLPPKEKEIILPNAPYQRNVLREKYFNQTSPIGIVRRENNDEKTINNARELSQALNEEQHEKELSRIENNKKNYLDEVSKKMNEASNLNEIDRTAFEIKQEEDAIISYQELMSKKDELTMVDEEDAVISIEELINRQKQQEKIYNITSEEENNTFIDELKHFRHDL